MPAPRQARKLSRAHFAFMRCLAQFLDERDSWDRYAVWSARATYRINRKRTAALNINNLFDKSYYQTIGSATTGGNWYGTPRSVTASLQALF